MENVAEFLENIDNNFAYYEIPTRLACTYLKGHFTGRALDYFEVLGNRVVEDEATDYMHLKQALTEQFPVLSGTDRNSKHVSMRHSKKAGVPSPEFRDENQNVGNRLPNWNRQENWRETRGNNRYSDSSRPQREFNSDASPFWLNGYVNKQNCHIWSEANPQEAMITNFFIPELNNHDVQELWFQQDGSICHTVRARIDLLKDTLGERLISRFVPVHWPPRSCDLTPLDYFLWGYVKTLVYANKPQTLENLEDNIRRVIADIRPQKLEKVI
ncbi:uncharacterized protein TNCV_4182901 [Trichonephila clavipes]|nr:uncharacterized protein TNCV_4182901 [Trichonephila clavipes]